LSPISHQSNTAAIQPETAFPNDGKKSGESRGSDMRQRTFLLATVSCLALTGAASAADLPARMPVKAPPPVVVAQSWAGPYIGLNGGAVWHRLETERISPFFDVPQGKVTAVGATLGGQVGYNWQSQNFVYGLEADLNWVSASETETVLHPGFLPVTNSTKLNWLATVRARAGVAFGRTLWYGTGGLAVGGVKNIWTFPPSITCGAAVSCDRINRQTRVGWTAGGGIEHAVSSNVTVKVEALYVDLGTRALSEPGVYTSRFKNTSVVGRAGVNLKW
jgi:outer membrane immunogenic protein